jgi:RNA polymerase sigma-70 factor (ECF subfamily)
LSTDDRDPSAVFCLVPAGADGTELALIEARFAAGCGVRVIRERRHRERRGQLRRLRPPSSLDRPGERRRVRNPNGRRVDERRAAVTERVAAGLRPGVRLVAHRPGEDKRRDKAASLRLVVRFQQGDAGAFRTLYERHFDGVYGYLLTALRDRHDAEDAAQDVFIRVLEALPQYEFRGSPLEAWLFTIVRNHTLNVKQRSAPVSPADPSSIDLWRDRRERRVLAGDHAPGADRNLLALVERLPASQRQVLVLRYMVGLDWRDIAIVLGRSPGAARQLEQRALTYLRTRLEAAERPVATRTRSIPMRRRAAPSAVVTGRRSALLEGTRVA